MAPYTDEAEPKMGPAMELVDSRETFFVNLAEDVGEAVGRTTSSNPTDVGTYPVLAFDIHTRPARVRVAEKRLHEREGAGLNATEAANGETKFPEPKAGAAIDGLGSYASPAPILRQRQKQRKSVNAIDDLFQGLN